MKLYQRGEIWWVTYGSKPQRRVSTGLKDKAAAEEYALRVVAPAMTERAAVLLERSASLRREAVEQRAAILRLEDVFNACQYQARHRVKASSVEAAGSYWRRLAAYCAERGVHDVAGLTPELCRGFVAALGPRSAQCAVLYCRQLLRDAGCTRDLMGSVPRRRGEPTHREPLTPEQIDALLDDTDRMAVRAGVRPGDMSSEVPLWMRILLYTGLRMGDAATMSVGMYDAKTGFLKRRQGKTGKTVEFPVHKSLRGLLDARAASAQSPDEPVCPKIAAQYRRDRRVLSRHVARMLARIGVTGAPGQYCAHCLRATFATICAEHGVPMAVIQSWMGHASQMVTRIYARIEDKRRKRAAMERFPDLG